MDLGVKGRPYLIFGGTRGIGRATAECLAAEGALVAAVGRDHDRCQEVAASLHRAHGTPALGIAAVDGSTDF